MQYALVCIACVDRHTLIYCETYLGAGRIPLYRVVTVFGQKEFAALRAFCRRNRLSLYSLAKASIREYVLRHA
jgi:hypothetical protein